MLSHRERRVADHLKEHLPKLHQQLVKSGQLENRAREMWSNHTAALADNLHQGLAYDQALELSRELAFPPAESADDAPTGHPTSPGTTP